MIDSFNRKAVGQLMLWPLQHGFIFKKQRRRYEWSDGFCDGLAQNHITRARPATQRGNENRRIKHNPMHIP